MPGLAAAARIDQGEKHRSLVFAGVIGGMIAFGLVGIFVGAVVLAGTYTLLENWVLDGERRANR